MGLDIVHALACMEPHEVGDVVYLEELSEEAVVDYGFHAYIQDVPDVEHLHTAFLFPNLAELKVFEKNNRDSYAGRRTLLVGSWLDSSNEISKMERKHGLKRAQAASDLRSVRVTGKDRAGRSYEQVGYFKDIFSLGLYYKKVGYQRKGMRPEFEAYCRPDFVHVRKRCFADMVRYVDHSVDAAVAENVRQNFIERYERGRSMLLVTS